MSDLAEKFEERQELITSIIQDALDNELLDNQYVGLLFKELSGEILVFERTGVNLITNRMQHLVDNSIMMSAILQGHINDEKTITIQQVIESRLIDG